MTDLEISKALALAIGWRGRYYEEGGECTSDVEVFGGIVSPDEVKVWTGQDWRNFDYRDPAVIWPIAERYNCFPYKRQDNFHRPTDQWIAFMGERDSLEDTAAKAVAIAVIRAKT